MYRINLAANHHTTMEDHTGEELVKYKRCSVEVKEVRADDASVETICISHSLVEILVKDPVCGRSDYSDLPGVRRGVCSSWRSFAEYPRRTSTSVRHLADASANSELRQQKNYEAKIRRENLTLQRIAKRERLRAQQRERRRQQTFINKLQDQAANESNSSLNPGVIISSPKKGSLKKLPRRDHSEDGHGQKTVNYGENSKTLVCDNISQKPQGKSKGKVNYDVNSFDEGDDTDDHTGNYFDDVVSTTSAHHEDVGTSESSKPSLISTMSSASQDKNSALDSIRESDDNPVTSSSQDSAETSLKPIPSDRGRPSVSTTCIVTSTTTPEIADADSSTTSTPRRKTRNVKRVDYTEMLEDDFDNDLEQQQPFRESVNSGRKIRPVKRTLEKAIVDASLKKSPRKKKAVVDKKGEKGGSQPNSASSSHTDIEADQIKEISNVSKKSSAGIAQVADKQSIVASKRKQKQCKPNSVSAAISGHGMPASTPAIFQPHSLCLSNASGGPLPVHSAVISGSLSNRQQNHSHQFVSSMPPSTPLAFQPLVYSYQQQPYLATSVHTTTMPPSPSLQNPPMTNFNTFSSVMQSQFQRPMPLMNAQDAIRYPASSLTLPQASMQIHTSQTLLAGGPPFPKATVVYDMNQSIQSPGLFLEPQPFIPAPNNAACSVSTYQPVVKQETATSVAGLLNDSLRRAAVADQHTSNTQLNSAVTAQLPQAYCPQNMMTDNSQTQFSTSTKHMGRGSSTVANNGANRGNTEVFSGRKQSQLDVETMLSFIQKSKISGKSIDNSNDKLSSNKILSSEPRCNQNLRNSNSVHTVQSAQRIVVAPRLTSQDVPGLIPKLTKVQSQPQYVTCSQSPSPQGHSSGQPAPLQHSYQSMEKNQVIAIGPPPPLISVSELLNSSIGVSSLGLQHGSPASLTYQNISSLTAPHSKHELLSRGTSPSASQSVLEKYRITGDMAAQVESLMQRSVMTAKPSSASQHKVGPLYQPSMQRQLSHPALQYPDAFLLSNKVNPTQLYSGSPQDKPLRMPTFMSFINHPHLTEGSKESCQTNRMPGQCFTDKPISHSATTQQHLTSGQRVATGMTICQKPQIPISQESRNRSDEPRPNVIGRYRLPEPRFTHKLGATAVQQYHAQNHRKTTLANSRVPTPNPNLVTLRETRPPAHWKQPLRQDPAQSARSTSAVGKHCHDHVLQKTSLADCLQLHTNLQSVPSTVFQQRPTYSKSSYDAKVQIASSNILHPFPRAEDQRALEQVSSMMAANKLQASGITWPNRTSGATVQNANWIPSPQYTMPTDKSVVSASQIPHKAGSGCVANRVPCALDLSQKSSSGSGQKPVANLVASSVNPSVTTMSRLPQQKPVTMLVASSIASSVNPFVTTMSRLPQQKPVTMLVASSIASSVNTSVASITRLPQQKPITTPLTLPVRPPVTTVSSLPPGHSTTTTNQPADVACDYPLTRGQIKQEMMSQHDQSGNDTRHTVQPDLRTSRMPAEERLTSCHMDEGRPVHATSTLSSALSAQNAISARDVTNVQISHSVDNLRDSTTVNASLMPLPACVNNPRTVGELNKVKVETYLSHNDYSEMASPAVAATTVASSMSLVPSASFTRAPQIPGSALVTSGTTEPHLSNLGGIPRPGLAQPQAHETLHAVRGSHADSQHSVPSHQSIGMKDALPAHIRIKQEIHAGRGSHADGQHCEPSDGQHHVPSDGQHRVPSDGQHRVPSDGQHRVPSDGQHPVPSDGQHCVPSDGQHCVPSDGQHRVPSDGQHRVSSDGQHCVPSDGQHRVPSHQPMVMKDALPAHIRIKHEIHADRTENLTSSNMSSTFRSLMQASVASVAHNHKASDLEVNKSLVLSSDSGSTLTAASTTPCLPNRSDQFSASTAESVTSAVAGDIPVSPLTSTESTLSSYTVHHYPDSQPIIPRAASHTQYINDSINSAYGICSQPRHPRQYPTPNTVIKVERSSMVDSSSFATTENSVAKSSIPACHAAVNQTVIPACSSAITKEAAVSIAAHMPSSCTQMVNNNCDKYPFEAPAKTQREVVVAPLPPATSPNKPPVIKASPSNLDCVLNDPLFVWHTDSNKQVSSFSLNDITHSLPQEYEHIPGLCSDISMINNLYTVTVSYPCTENSDLLHCATEASHVDTSVVKEEPAVEPVLNQREIIDLCLSDSEEHDLTDTGASSCLQTSCQDSISSISQLACSSKRKHALEHVKAALPVTDRKDRQLSGDNLQRTPTKEHSVSSEQYGVMSPLAKSATGCSDVSKFTAKQIIRSPLTGQNVTVTGEHMTFIRRRLARISTDLMSIASDNSESESSSISTTNLSNTPPRKVIGSVLCDSVTQVCDPQNSLLHASRAGVKDHPAVTQSANTSANTPKTQLFSTLEANTKRAPSARKRTRGVEVKKEYIETISIDDDSDDGDFPQSEMSHCSKTPDMQLSGMWSPSPSFTDAAPSIFSTSFGSRSPILSPHKDLSSLSGSESSLSHGGGSLLASVANWTNAEVSEWLKNHKLDKVCPNLKNLDGRGLQRMAFEHQRDPDMFYSRVKKTLGLTFFQTMVICHSMKELNDSGLDDS